MNVPHDTMIETFGHQRITFYDPDQQRLELVGVEGDELDQSTGQVWETAEVVSEHAIRSFYSARLAVVSRSLIEPILELALGYQQLAQVKNITLYQIPGQSRAALIEVEEAPSMEPGLTAAGTVHHIAFAVDNEAIQLKVRDKIRRLGLHPTEVINRYYFKSVYFRTPAGILFELATIGPGFTADEAESALGEKLALPPFLEPQRAEIEAGLAPLD